MYCGEYGYTFTNYLTEQNNIKDIHIIEFKKNFKNDSMNSFIHSLTETLYEQKNDYVKISSRVDTLKESQHVFGKYPNPSKKSFFTRIINNQDSSFAKYKLSYSQIWHRKLDN